MPQSDMELSVAAAPARVPGIMRRALSKVFSSAHLVLSGTTAAIVVVFFLGCVFVLVTLRNHRHDEIRAHTIQVTNLSGAIENDIDDLENHYRGFLLAPRREHFEAFQNRRSAMKRRLEELTGRLLDS